MKKTQYANALSKACPIKIKYRTNSYENAVDKLKNLEKCDSSNSVSSQSEAEFNKKRRSKPNSVFKEFEFNFSDQSKSHTESAFKTFSRSRTNHISDSSYSCPVIPQPSRNTSCEDFDRTLQTSPSETGCKEKTQSEPITTFKELHIIYIETRVCLRKNPLTKNVTEAEMSAVIKIWLRTAGDCLGGHSRRSKVGDIAIVDERQAQI